MKRISCLFVVPIVAVLCSLAPRAEAIVLGQVDNFQDGTVMNWDRGGFAPPLVNVSTGGPSGTGDRYMRVTADGSGSGGRLTTFNFSQWLGDYISAGVTGFEVDLLNLSAVTLTIRFAFLTENVQGSSGYLSQPMVLAPGSGWQHFSIAITPSSLIAVGAPPDFQTFFSNFNAQLRIIHSPGTTSTNGDPVVAQLGIDNIRAVPEPAGMTLAAAGLLLVALHRHRRRRRQF